MRDMEDRLRELLDQRAEDAASGSTVRMPAEVGARVRRRQALTAVLSGVTLLAIVSLSVLGTRAILKPEMIGQPQGPAGRPFTVFDPPIRVAEGRFRLASGVASGESWNLLAHREAREQGGTSLEVMAPSNGGPVGAGSFTVPEERDLETTTAWVGTNRYDQIIFGAVVEEAADVHLESEDGRTIRGVVISLPESLLPTFDVVVIQASGPVNGDIVVTDEVGQEIVREPYLPPPPPPPIPTFAPTPPIRPGEPIPLFDHFGNAVGFVPWDQAFGEPSGPPGALEEGFPWTPPGLQPPEVTVEEIRATAQISLIRLWAAVRSWWDSRPKPGSPDSAFLRWWASYPIGTEPVPEVVEISPQVIFSPPRGVRGADLRVTVEGLDYYSGAQVELSFVTKDGTWGQGVGSEEYRVDDKGRLEATITVPGVLAHEYQVLPGEYRMIFGVKPVSPESFSFEETLQVIAADVGEKYPVSPYVCLEYTSFDGRLWQRESGDVTTPVPGSTIELTASDRAVYMTPEGKTVVFRVANPTAIDPETYRCPSA